MEIRKLAAFWLAQELALGPAGLSLIRECFGDEKTLFLASRDEIDTRIKTFRWNWNNNAGTTVDYNDNSHDGNRDKHIENNNSYYIEEKASRRFFNSKTIEKLLDITLKKDILSEYKRVSKNEIKFYRKSDPEFPEKLRGIPNPPEQLFVRGELPDPDSVAIGIVGARNCTPYGRDMARMFSFRLAQAGVAVISGMARGIDSWSHRGAIEADGLTYAVLGCGVEICFPTTNSKLYREIPEHGGLISEYPTKFGPFAQNFPVRNRIISGLSDGILVVEARIRSGSLITADAALDQGKDVFVIPGRIGDELSVGCNRLIRQGAIPVLTPEDILEYYSIDVKPETSQELTSDERQIYNLIGTVPISLTDLADASQGTLANTIRVVLDLKKRRLIRESSRDRYIRM
ncbi:MAG: DNA-processing protein DprA [Eubacterium sp.]|nr:DNA-processing protein DprA [Eubacterium sp.]